MSTYKVIMLAATLFTTVPSFGQNSKSQYMSVGPVVGMGHSWLSDRNNVFKPSAHLGLGLVYSKHENWGVGGIVTVSHEGYAYEYVRNGSIYKNAVDPTYLRMNPRVYYFFGRYTDVVRPKLFIGPSLGVKLTEDRYYDEPLMNGDYVTYNTSSTFNTMDLGINTGAGVNIKLGTNTWLNLDADYYHGLTNATPDGSKNRALRANAGLMFGF